MGEDCCCCSVSDCLLHGLRCGVKQLALNGRPQILLGCLFSIWVPTVYTQGIDCSLGSGPNNEPQYTFVRDFRGGASVWRSLQNYCYKNGWTEASVSRYLTECYETAFKSMPPFLLDMSAVGNCVQDRDALNYTVCESCNDCVKPLMISVFSLNFEEFVYDSKSKRLSVTVATEIYWPDPRLYGTLVSDIQSVWHPTLSIEAYQVGESSAGVEERLETVLSEEKFEAPVFVDGDFVVKKSRVSCAGVQFQGNCNVQNLLSCGVTERLERRVQFSLASANFIAYPFDSHTVSMELSFANPYDFLEISPEGLSGYGLSDYMYVDWGFCDSTDTCTNYTNGDGSTSYAHSSVSLSLSHLSVPGFSKSMALTYKPNSMGGYYELNVTLTRNAKSFSVRYIVPTIIMALIACGSSWLDTAKAGPRIQVSILGMLIAVSLANSAAKAAPASALLTFYDELVVVSLIFPFACLIESWTAFWFKTHGEEKIVSVMDGIMRIGAPLLYVSVVITIALAVHAEPVHITWGALMIAGVLLWISKTVFAAIRTLRKPHPVTTTNSVAGTISASNEQMKGGSGVQAEKS